MIYAHNKLPRTTTSRMNSGAERNLANKRARKQLAFNEAQRCQSDDEDDKADSPAVDSREGSPIPVAPAIMENTTVTSVIVEEPPATSVIPQTGAAFSPPSRMHTDGTFGTVTLVEKEEGAPCVLCKEDCAIPDEQGFVVHVAEAPPAPPVVDVDAAYVTPSKPTDTWIDLNSPFHIFFARAVHASGQSPALTCDHLDSLIMKGEECIAMMQNKIRVWKLEFNRCATPDYTNGARVLTLD
jgi:hypothetical protein